MTELSREDFEARFVAEMMTYASVYDGYENELRDYAVSIASSYYDEPDQRADGPEECARADVGYW
ncbi:hypothetical protein [Brevundimonas aurantiaca]|uniref:hypothetical protein n=1 Tax=Brevundimonas aurantiaca TaxID=74316 RepID=UPI001D195F0B|nr:hypothetical protein [Brevundimonas aurantiaca]MCC4295806.1 hypothetical protein [Brevundimonas aurantiaca]